MIYKKEKKKPTTFLVTVWECEESAVFVMKKKQMVYFKLGDKILELLNWH